MYWARYLLSCALILDLLLINTEAGNEWHFLSLYSTVVSNICRIAEPLHSSSFQVIKNPPLTAESVLLIFKLDVSKVLQSNSKTLSAMLI